MIEINKMCVCVCVQKIKFGRIYIEGGIFTESYIINCSFSDFYLIFEKVIQSHGIKIQSSRRLSSDTSPPSHPVLLLESNSCHPLASFGRI